MHLVAQTGPHAGPHILVPGRHQAIGHVLGAFAELGDGILPDAGSSSSWRERHRTR